jgi:hypothetical protein
MGTATEPSRRIKFRIEECTMAHLRAIVPRLRDLDRAEAESAGTAARHLLHQLWHNSPFRRAAFLDGEIACVGGYVGSVLSTEGEAWLFTTAVVERAPLSFVRGLQVMVAEMLETKTSLVSAVMAEYDRSIKLMEMIGFTVGEARPAGPNGVLFRELRMER